MFHKILAATAIGLFSCLGFTWDAHAQSCSSYYPLTNGTTADATQVMANFNCAARIQSPSINSATFTGTTTFNGGISEYGSGISVNSTDPYGAGLGLLNQTTGHQWLLRYDGGSLLGQTDTFTIFDNTVSAPRFVINPSGQVGINTATTSYTLFVNGYVAGMAAYINLSDARLKKNVRPIENALSMLENIQGVRFQWKTIAERTVGKEMNLDVGQDQVGFIAQDLEKVLPEAVSTSKGKEPLKSVAESKVVPLLVQAIKELKAANDSQAAEIRALRTQQLSEIGKLQTRFDGLERKIRFQTAQQ